MSKVTSAFRAKASMLAAPLHSLIRGEEVSVKVSGNLEANNCDALRAAIFADLGLALRPLWDVWKDLRDGRLVRLLPANRPPVYPINAVHPSRRLMPKKTRVFIEHLLQGFGPTPYWNRLADPAPAASARACESRDDRGGAPLEPSMA